MIFTTTCACWISHSGLSPLFAVIKTTLLGRLSIRFWSVAVGMCAHSATGALWSSGTDVWWGGLTLWAVHPKGVQSGWGQGSVQGTQALPLQTWQTMSSWASVCAQRHYNAATCLGLLVSVKGNATAYKSNQQISASSFLAKVTLCLLLWSTGHWCEKNLLLFTYVLKKIWIKIYRFFQINVIFYDFSCNFFCILPASFNPKFKIKC